MRYPAMMITSSSREEKKKQPFSSRRPATPVRYHRTPETGTHERFLVFALTGKQPQPTDERTERALGRTELGRPAWLGPELCCGSR